METLLQLHVKDQDVMVELAKFVTTAEMNDYALGALRIGVLALRMAAGEIDAAAIKDAGQQVIAEIKNNLTTWSTDTTRTLNDYLTKYFDPQSGAFDARIKRFLSLDGELEKTMEALIGKQSSSLLVTTLTEQLGDKSPMFRLLSPDSPGSVGSQIKTLLDAALQTQQDAIKVEFSLDKPDSAVSRMLQQVQASMDKQTGSIDQQIASVIGEFSLDKPDSALSRLVGRVENVLKTINEQFSLDVPTSGLNRIMQALDAQDQKNVAFHADVREHLARIQAKKEAGERTTLHGIEFEAQLGELLHSMAQRYNDLFEAVGNTTGAIKLCKKGDHVTTLGSDCVAGGARIVWEAKEAGGYTLKTALDEVEEARKNRQAQIGIFVFSSKSAPGSIGKVSRHGNNLVVVWDAESPADTITIDGAYSIARALCTRQRAASDESTAVVHDIDKSVRAVEKQSQFLEDMISSAMAISNHSDKIADRARKMRDDLKKEVQKLDEAVRRLSAHAE